MPGNLVTPSPNASLRQVAALSTRMGPQLPGVAPPEAMTPEQQRAQEKFASATRTTIDELLGLQQEQTKATAGAEAAKLTAAGYGKEVEAYDAAASTSEESARLADVSGQIQAYQDTRKYQSTAGAQAAAVAGRGFKNAGSALYLASSSMQQASLTQQLDRLNGTEKQIGYLETAAASRAQSSAAGVAAAQGELLAKSDTDLATATGRTVSDLSTAMQGYFKTVDPNSVTPETALSMSLLSSNPDASLSKTAGDLTTKATAQNTTWDAAAGGGIAGLGSGLGNSGQPVWGKL